MNTAPRTNEQREPDSVADLSATSRTSRPTPLGLLKHWYRRLRANRAGRTPSDAVRQLAAETLGAAELTLFNQLSPTEQAHAGDVALATQADLASLSPASLAATRDGRDVLVAALLHDVGKVGAANSVTARVVATLLGPLLPTGVARKLERATRHRTGRLTKLRRLLCYPLRGQQLLAGHNALAAAWAAEHHRPRRTWTVPVDVGDLLWAADRASS